MFTLKDFSSSSTQESASILPRIWTTSGTLLGSGARNLSTQALTLKVTTLKGMLAISSVLSTVEKGSARTGLPSEMEIQLKSALLVFS